jgi:RNA polymerase sigma-70 factor, ECF subfamily
MSFEYAGNERFSLSPPADQKRLLLLLEGQPKKRHLSLPPKNRDGKAFEALFKRHQRRLLALAVRYTHSRHDAEDVLQQSLQKAFVCLHKFEGKSSFSTWLTRIAINEGLMFLRRGRGRREVSIDEDSVVEKTASNLEIPDSDPDPETSYLQREEARILSGAMDKLQPGLRRAIVLRELAELSTEETARRMGISIGAVKARLFHGRKKLREALRCQLRSQRMSASDMLVIASKG